MSPRSALAGLFLLLGLCAPLRADDDAQALVDRAIQALGGEARLNRARSLEMNMKGTVFASPGDPQPLPFTATAWMQLPDQFKHAMVYERAGNRITQVQVCRAGKFAIRIGNNVIKIEPELESALLAGRFADSLTHLTLLKNKELKVTSLGESKVEKQPALGLKVEAPGRPEVRLFFDKTTALLLKTEHRQLDPRTRTEVIQEVFFHNYRAFDTAEDDERILKGAKVGTDAAGLLAYFKKQTGGNGDRERIAALVRQLGDDAFDKREEAVMQLIAIGDPAVPFLKEALKSGDPEVMRRAERCLKKIGTPGERKEETAVPAAAARLLAARAPAGAAELLLRYLLGTTDEHLAREVRAALAAVAVIDGKADPALMQAAADRDPARRAAALEALGKTPLPAGRKLLLDGLKRPSRIAVYRAGHKFMEWDITEVTYLNRLDDSTFEIK